MRGPYRGWIGAVVLIVGCAGAGQGRFASPVAPLSGCYAFNYGPWPSELDGDGAEEKGLPDPKALPNVVELSTARVGDTDEVSIDGRIHEVRSHGRPGRGILHFWRMVSSDSLVIWTGGPRGFRLEVGLAGRQASGTTRVFTEVGATPVASAPLTGVRSPCPRQAVPRR